MDAGETKGVRGEPILTKGITALFAKPGVLLALFVVAFFGINLSNLLDYPLVWQDEGWFANPAYNLAFSGHMGTTLFPDWNNIDKHTYWQPPVYFVLLAGVFKIIGFGILQARLLSLAFGAAGILLTFSLAKRLFDSDRVALLAALIVSVDHFFAFSSRSARMDIVAATFGLLALILFLKSMDGESRWWLLGSGASAGLSGFTHPVGVAVFFAILVMFPFYFRRKELVIRLIFFGLPILALALGWGAYILQDFGAFREQFFTNAGNPAFQSMSIPEKVAFELQRRYLVPYNIKRGLILAVNALSLLYITYRAFRSGTPGTRLLAVVLWTYLIILTFLEQNKNELYLVHLVPYLSIAVAYSAFDLKDKLRVVEASRMLPGILVILVILYLGNHAAEAGIRYIQGKTQGEGNNYDKFTRGIAAVVPAGSTVIGSSQDWFGLESKGVKLYDIMSIHSLPGWRNTYEALPKVDFILMDDRMGNYVLPRNPDMEVFVKRNTEEVAKVGNSASSMSYFVKVLKVK